MKKILLTKMADLGWQILPVVDFLIHPRGIGAGLGMYGYLGLIQTASSLLNLIFLKRKFRSPLRIIYELLLLAFYGMVISEVLDRGNARAYFSESSFWVFCTVMAIGYGVISCHEIWKIQRLIKEDEQRATDRNEW